MLPIGEQSGYLAQAFRLEPEQRVRAELDRDRPLGVVAQREAGDAQHSRLFLDPAGVRHDRGRLRLEREKLPVRQRLRQEHARRSLEVATGSWMHGKDHRQRLRDVVECRDCPGEQVRHVDEARAVQCHEDVATGLQAEVTPGLERQRVILVRPERVDHRVADERDLRGQGFGVQIRVRVVAVGQQQGREVVGDDAVAFLGHRPVPTAQAGLDVADGDAAFGRRDRCGKCRVHVSGNDDELRSEVGKEAFELSQCVRERRRFELDVRFRQRELCEEDVFHDRVVVLAGVDELLVDVALLFEGGVDGRYLHVVRPRADDVGDEGSAGHSEESRRASGRDRRFAASHALG